MNIKGTSKYSQLASKCWKPPHTKKPPDIYQIEIWCVLFWCVLWAWFWVWAWLWVWALSGSDKSCLQPKWIVSAASGVPVPRMSMVTFELPHPLHVRCQVRCLVRWLGWTLWPLISLMWFLFSLLDHHNIFSSRLVLNMTNESCPVLRKWSLLSVYDLRWPTSLLVRHCFWV